MFDEVPTGEIRRCSECSKEFEHVAIMMNGKDIDSENHVCPECRPAFEEKERQERDKQEEGERQKAYRAKRLKRWERTIPVLYRDTDPGHTDYPLRIHDKAMGWMNSILSNEPEPSPFFGLIGTTGKCKTRISSQVLKRAILAGRSTEWINATEFQRLVQSQWSSSPTETSPLASKSVTVGEQAKKRLDFMRNCDVLALDDLGKGRLTETVAGAIYDILEERASRKLAIIWTSNATPDSLLNMLPKDSGGPIVRRLIEFSLIIRL